MTTNSRTPSRAYLVGGFLLAMAYFLGPPALRTGPVFNLIGLSSIAAILIGVRLNHPPKRLPWHLFALGQCLFITGDVIAYNYMRFFDKPLPFPAISDVFYLAVYPCLIAGVVLLVRQRRVERDATVFTDALIVAIGASLLSWFYLISPYAQSADLTAVQKIVSIAYPVMDLLLLMALVRLAVGPGHRGGAFNLLIAGATCLLVTDAIYGWLLANVPGGYSNGGLLDGGWAAFYILWAAAALHPSMGEIARNEGVGDESRRRSLRLRLLLLAATSILPPAVQVVESLRGRPVSSPIAGVLSATLFILVLVRMNGLLADVHQLKETQGKLRQSQKDLRDALEREKEGSKELRQLDEMKNIFLSAVSHELRNPLTFILGTSSLLETRFDSLSKDEVVELLGHTRRSAKKLQSLLDDLLDVERLRQGRVTLERGAVDLAELTAEVVDDLGPREDHDLIVDVPAVEIHADRSKIERVLINLITNAFKYCPTGSRVWVRAEDAGDSVELVVEDEGPGIADSDREVIFDAFQRVNEGTSSGTGIGLLLVSKFAEMHGGRAWVQERPGGGASFHVSLPKEEEPLPEGTMHRPPERQRLPVQSQN